MRETFVICYDRNICCADLESLLEKMNTCHNNPEKSTVTINKHTLSDCSLFTHCSFYNTKNNQK